MEDFALDIVIGQGPSARSIRLDLARHLLGLGVVGDDSVGCLTARAAESRVPKEDASLQENRAKAYRARTSASASKS